MNVLPESDEKHTIIIFFMDDWQCWYVDGKLVFDHHSMEDISILKLCQDLGPFNFSWVHCESFVDNRDREQELFEGRNRYPMLASLLLELTDSEFAKLAEQVVRHKNRG